MFDLIASGGATTAALVAMAQASSKQCITAPFMWEFSEKNGGLTSTLYVPSKMPEADNNCLPAVPAVGKPAEQIDKIKEMQMKLIGPKPASAFCDWDKCMFYRANRPSFFRSIIRLVGDKSFLNAALAATGAATHPPAKIRKWLETKWSNFTIKEFAPIQDKVCLYGGEYVRGELHTGNWGMWRMKVLSELKPTWSQSEDVRGVEDVATELVASIPYRVSVEQEVVQTQVSEKLDRIEKALVRQNNANGQGNRRRRQDDRLRANLAGEIAGLQNLAGNVEVRDRVKVEPLPSKLYRGKFYAVQFTTSVQDNYGSIRKLEKRSVIYGDLFHYLLNRFMGADTCKQVLHTSATFYRAHNIPADIMNSVTGPTVDAAFMYLRCLKDMSDSEAEQSFV
jgi:hypothetical protein